MLLCFKKNLDDMALYTLLTAVKQNLNRKTDHLSISLFWVLNIDQYLENKINWRALFWDYLSGRYTLMSMTKRALTASLRSRIISSFLLRDPRASTFLVSSSPVRVTSPYPVKVRRRRKFRWESQRFVFTNRSFNNRVEYESSLYELLSSLWTATLVYTPN